MPQSSRPSWILLLLLFACCLVTPDAGRRAGAETPVFPRFGQSGEFAFWFEDSVKAALFSAPAPVPSRYLEIVYEGELLLEGHYRRPGDTRQFRSRQVFTTDDRGSIRLDWTPWSEGDTSRIPQSYLVHGSDVFHRDAPGAPWEALSGEQKESARTQVLAGVPWEWLREIEAGTRSGRARVADPSPPPHVTWQIRDVPGASEGGPIDLSLEPRSGGLKRLRIRRAHPRLGDVVDEASYSCDAENVPTALHMALHERDHQWVLEERRVSLNRERVADSILVAPTVFEPPSPEPESLTPDLKPRPLAPGLWSIDMEDIDSRSLVVEFADHLAVLEAAVGSENGERIVDVAKRTWPKKPIRYFLFSHHHPHYMGGLRAFVATGATVVTTPGNAALAERTAAYPFTIAPDRLARAPRRPQIQTFAKRFELKDRKNHLIAIDIGARSDHTDEFVVFWFPKQKLVFETEQGWVTVEGALRASRRAENFLKTLAQEGIVPERLVQSWPMRGNRAELTSAELEALILARKR